MVQERTCDYTGEEIEPGTGKMYVKTDGTVFWFKDSKAQKNYFMGRESRDLEWIGYEEDEPEAEADEPAEPDDEPTESEADDSEDADEADAEDADEAADEQDEETEAEA